MAVVVERRGRRWRSYMLAAAILAVAVGSLAAALLLAGGGGDEVYKALTEIESSVDVALIEYYEAVEDGEVVSEGEYRAALRLVDRAIESFESVRQQLEALDPESARLLGETLYRIRGMMEGLEDPDSVEGEVLRVLELVARLRGSEG